MVFLLQVVSTFFSRMSSHVYRRIEKRMILFKTTSWFSQILHTYENGNNIELHPPWNRSTFAWNIFSYQQ